MSRSTFGNSSMLKNANKCTAVKGLYFLEIHYSKYGWEHYISMTSEEKLRQIWFRVFPAGWFWFEVNDMAHVYYCWVNYNGQKM